MTFLQKLCSASSKGLLILTIISCVSFSAIAQDVAPENQGELYRNAAFKGEPISLNVVNADIRDILLYITEQYGINFVIDKSVAAVPVTINVSNVPWNIALDSILRSQELDVDVNGPILRIAQQKTLAKERELQKEIDAAQLDKSPLYTEFVRLNYARADGAISGGGFKGGATSVSPSAGSSGGGGSNQGILGIVQKRLSRRGTIEVDGRSNTLIITDVKENIAALRKLVYYLDQPVPQVEIESRIVVATRSFSRDLGVQLSLGFSNSDTTGSANTNFGLSDGAPSVISLVTNALGTTRISALITAGEQKGQVKTIATPRITVLNNRSGEIESGQQIPVTTIQPGSGVGGVAVSTTEYVPVPLRLQVTPQITNVGTVILNVVAENNSVPINTGDGAPPISVQRMQTEVMVPDGGTTVVGGALFDSESEIKDRTPGLSRIPLIGKLFQRNRVARDTNEIMFFVTPRIYRPDYNGKPISGNVDPNNPSSVTLLQPVPLGNPPSNSTENNSNPPSNNPNQPPAAQPQSNAPAGSVVKTGNR